MMASIILTSWGLFVLALWDMDLFHVVLTILVFVGFIYYVMPWLIWRII